jgi:hypothetical protein
MLRRMPTLLASLAVVAALCAPAGPLAAQTAPPVQVETPAPLGTGARPPAVPDTTPPSAPPVSLRPCAASDLVLREVIGKADGAPPAVWTYAVKNRSGSACRLVGSAGFKLLDASGKELPLHFAPRTMMAMLLTLAAGNEASFTVTYAPHARDAATDCAKSARIEVFFPDQLAPLSAKTTMPACSGLVVRVSNLRLGVASTVVPTPASLVT